jgi:hypothetical protein
VISLDFCWEIAQKPVGYPFFLLLTSFARSCQILGAAVDARFQQISSHIMAWAAKWQLYPAVKLF